MKIGEFFVSLGIKGDDKSKRAVGELNKGLGEVKSISLGAKAAIAAVIYGLHNITSQSAKAGAEILRFGEYTGLSTKKLQEWQYAAKLASVSNEDVSSSIKNVQSAIADMLLGKGAPEGMNVFSAMVDFDVNKARDTFYVLEKLQEFSQKAPKDVGNSILEGFGLTEGMITAMRRNAFNATTFSKAPLYSPTQIKQLEEVNVLWSTLSHNFEVALGKITADKGIPVIEDITEASVELAKLTASLVELADKLQVFKGIGQIIKGWNELFKSTKEGADFLSSDISKEKKTEGVKEFGLDVLGWMKELVGGNVKRIDDLMIKPAEAIKMHKLEGMPKQGAFLRGSSLNINQNLNFRHEGKEAKKISESTKSATVEAFRQFNQGQEN